MAADRSDPGRSRLDLDRPRGTTVTGRFGPIDVGALDVVIHSNPPGRVGIVDARYRPIPVLRSCSGVRGIIPLGMALIIARIGPNLAPALALNHLPNLNRILALTPVCEPGSPENPKAIKIKSKIRIEIMSKIKIKSRISYDQRIAPVWS
jgi:hypothetical protein